MKRILITAAALSAGAASAEQLPLEHVLVSVPIHKKQAETALPVTVLSGEELQRQAAATIGETLSNQPGLANASFGPGVGRPVIRGQQGPRAVTLQNGTLSADVSSLSPDHGVAVEALLADSIEVLRGPSTLLYGGGAIGGVVNVIDNRIPRTAIDGIDGALEYRYDDASDMDSGVFRLEGGNGSAAFHLSGTSRETGNLDIPGMAIDEAALEEQEELLGGHEDHDEGEHEEEEVENTDGYIANTDTDFDMLTAGVSYHLGDEGFAGFSVSHLESKYGIPPGAHEHHHEDEHDEDHDEDHEEDHDEDHDHEHEEDENVRIDMEQTRYDAVAHLHEPMAGLDVMRGFVTYTDYKHKELEGAVTGTRFDRETWETRLELVHKPMFGAEHGVIGLQWRGDEFSAEGEEAYVPETESNEFGLFLVEDFHRGDWTFETGLRGDWVERDPQARNADEEDFLSASVSASALWQFASQWSSGLSLSSAQRAPTTEELFSNVDADSAEAYVTHAATGVIEVGDPDLDEEHSLNADLSLTWLGERSWAELGLFYNQFEDYIFLNNSGEEVDETPVYHYMQDDAEFYGVEFDSEFHLLRLGPGDLALGLSGDYVSGEFDDAGDVPRLPPLRVGAELSWRGDAFSTWVRVQDADDQDDPGDFETATDGYTRWDAGADYRFDLGDTRELLVFLKWKNISDEEIRLSTSFLRNVAPEAGESIEAGLRLSF
ncbi:MAG: TonB-dependent receptor [Halioglobus sp.]|nr:TonB-dependent receptor [Halioglobus sp.]MAT92717.1 TonB-dependent receptor [Halioglobus sp.]